MSRERRERESEGGRRVRLDSLRLWRRGQSGGQRERGEREREGERERG